MAGLEHYIYIMQSWLASKCLNYVSNYDSYTSNKVIAPV